MIPSTRRTRRLIIDGGLGLMVVAAAGGAGLSVAEGTGYSDGLALAFNTISTIGFGPGPQTGWGLAVTMMVFAAGAACWFAILVAAFEIGLRRSSTSVGGNGYSSIDEELWSRASLPRRRGGHG